LKKGEAKAKDLPSISCSIIQVYPDYHADNFLYVFEPLEEEIYKILYLLHVFFECGRLFLKTLIASHIASRIYTLTGASLSLFVDEKGVFDLEILTPIVSLLCN